MENVIIEKELITAAVTLKDQATAMAITNVDTYAAAGELGKSIKDLRSKIVDYFKPLKEAAHAAHKAVTTKESEELKPVDEAINILRLTMNKFNEEQEKIRKEAQRKADEEAAALAEKERQKLLAQAIKAEEKGQTEKAEEKLEQAEMVYVAPVTVAPTVAKTVQTASGSITQAAELKITVIDLKAFVAELVKSNPGALAQIVDIKTAGTKSFIKTNGIEHYPGLRIERVTGVRF